MVDLYNIIFCIVVTICLGACQQVNRDTDPMPEHSVQVVAEDFTFDCPADIPSGWHTFKFVNAGHAPHFFVLHQLPDSVEYVRYNKEVARPFDVVFDSIKAGMSQAKAGALLGELLPTWFFAGVRQMGGAGIVDPGMNAWVSMRLEPGTYVMECYIKEKGVFHSSLGMVRPMEVTEDSTSMKEPEANVELSLTNYKITPKGKLQAGWNTVAVHFKEHPEFGLGNDVQLIQVNDTTDMDEVIHWLNWMNVDGLEPPAPAKFLGGTQEMPVGYTAYVHRKFKSGRYAWIAESSAERGMIHTFQVKQEQ